MAGHDVKAGRPVKCGSRKQVSYFKINPNSLPIRSCQLGHALKKFMVATGFILTKYTFM